MPVRRTAWFVLFLFCIPAALAQPAEEQAVSAVLDALHDNAAHARFEAYFGLYTEDAVFLGTDATERWDLDAFKAYAKPAFDQGRGWTYTMTERHIAFAPDGHTAWFDEMLENAALGTCRGSGVLVRTGDGWKIAQYNLTIPIPNELARDVVARIRALPKE